MPISRTAIEPNVLNSSASPRQSRIEFYLSEPKYTLSDVVLSPKCLQQVEQFLSLQKNWELIFQQWKLGDVIKNYNLSANLYGPSGTGKTMTAHAIAHEIGKKLIIVNYAEIESKYVGETSKNLVALFSYAKENDAVILFDEADAILSKRVSNMNSATDVSVNQTRNVLLKLLDEYDGVTLFTTNYIQNYDPAFLRRIFTNIQFDFPTKEERIKLWQHYMPKAFPVQSREELVDSISEIENITGADIATSVLKAAITAAESGKRSVTFEMIRQGVEEIQHVQKAAIGEFEISTRKVSREYALQQINKEN